MWDGVLEFESDICCNVRNLLLHATDEQELGKTLASAPIARYRMSTW
jgi:hypothetical protein